MFLFPVFGQELDGKVTFLKADNNRYYTTDSPDWDNPDIQHDDWGRFDKSIREHDYRGLFWIAVDVYFDVKEIPQRDYEYRLHMYSAQEVYWDDQLIGVNGKPGHTKEQEVPGNVWTTYLIPNHLMTDGKHTIRIRGSSHYRLDNMKFLREGWIVPFDPGFRYVSFWSLVPSLLVSIAAVVGLYFLMLYFTEGRQLEHLVFFFLLENLTILGYAIQWGHLIGYTYDLEPLNLALEYISSIAVLILLPLYFMLKNNAKKIWAWFLCGAIVTIAMDFIISEVRIMGWFGSFGTALVVSVYYGIKRNQFIWWESIGLFACIIGLLTQDFEDVFMFFPSLFALILLTHAMAMQKRKKALQQALYIETQLRGELLRKHIQPHFVLNTLTSLMEWVETDVDRSTEFIAELAEEFRLMSAVSSEQLINLNTELELCDKHLSIMSLRLQKNCKILRKGVSGDEPFPPAIFHTLIENAFSHNAYDNPSVIFVLQKEVKGIHSVFTFTSPKARQQTSSYRRLGTGTGKKYIEARLSQAFGTHWSISEISNDEEWITQISVNYKKLNLTKDMAIAL